jgi:hypothetical protein
MAKTMTRWRKKCVLVAKKIVKILDKKVCQHCHKLTSWQDCQWSHIEPESGSKKLSCDPINIKVMCYNCHKNFRHLNPRISWQWFNKKFPDRARYIQDNIWVNGTIWSIYFQEKLEELKEDLKKLENWEDFVLLSKKYMRW